MDKRFDGDTAVSHRVEEQESAQAIVTGEWTWRLATASTPARDTTTVVIVI
jgi:hypothetical protein